MGVRSSVTDPCHRSLSNYHTLKDGGARLLSPACKPRSPHRNGETMILFHGQYALPALTRMLSVPLKDFYSRTVTGGRGDLLVPRDQRSL